MSTNDKIRQIIREELTGALQEAVLTKAAKILSERNRVRRGQKWSKKKERGVYTSAGTLPSSKGGKPKSKVDPAKREAIGKKLLNRYQRGDVRGGNKTKDTKAIEFRKKVDDIARDQYGGTPTAKEKFSVIWAQASLRSKVASNLETEKDASGNEKLVRVKGADSAAGKARARAEKAARAEQPKRKKSKKA